ncbi:histone-lysine N-methyltransferase, H3 lysine-79 specific-like [Anopheles cruzii]|uniref:histone-lysine N-methyltransferase, H3 lysine-79 specific-like n=1 Tax=Anopheles cruzii TaxID=68878 RepID=UPI0022EC29E6|nr:histone-lysine N-methyltransferase, H3 lysine-79 specific-like [Anopheles cruzii]
MGTSYMGMAAKRGTIFMVVCIGLVATVRSVTMANERVGTVGDECVDEVSERRHYSDRRIDRLDQDQEQRLLLFNREANLKPRHDHSDERRGVERLEERREIRDNRMLVRDRADRREEGRLDADRRREDRMERLDEQRVRADRRDEPERREEARRVVDADRSERARIERTDRASVGRREDRQERERCESEQERSREETRRSDERRNERAGRREVERLNRSENRRESSERRENERQDRSENRREASERREDRRENERQERSENRREASERREDRRDNDREQADSRREREDSREQERRERVVPTEERRERFERVNTWDARDVEYEDKLMVVQQENAFFYQLLQTAAVVGLLGYWLLKGGQQGDQMEPKKPSKMSQAINKLLFQVPVMGDKE